MNKCNLCNSDEGHFIKLFNKYSFTIVKCRNCGLVFSQEIPTDKDLLEYYDKSYYEGKIYSSYSSEEEQRKRYYTQQLMYYENFNSSRKGNLLEIGCATGSFLDSAKFFGYDAVGTEKSLYSAEISRARGHIVYTDDLEQLVNKGSLDKHTFDTVFMWDVFEHLSDPFLTLKYSNYLTKPGGMLVLNTLNISSPTVRYLKDKWSHYYPPFHLFYFNLKTLKMFLTKTGYSIVKCKTAGPLFYDDGINKYFILKGLFSNNYIQRITNKLKLGYAQFVIAKKVQEV